MKKGCFITIAVLVCLMATGVFVIYRLAGEYDKRPKKPGEAELFAAERLIMSHDKDEGMGNSPEAAAFAQNYARGLRLSRHALFTEGKEGAMSLSKGYFLTYCAAAPDSDSVAVIVHVPELRRFAPDAQVTLAEYAWTLASEMARTRFPKARRLAVGLKGVLNYAAIFTGEIHAEDPMKGLKNRHSVVSTEPLWPFFVTPEKAGTDAETVTREDAAARSGGQQ
jgi:hypothetical protein